MALASAPSAHAQLAASLSLQNDFRLRGASVSEKRPTMTVTVSEDLANGVYFGASVAAAEIDRSPELLGHAEYVGYARRMASGATWEVGADNVDYVLYPAPTFHLSYSEAYVGVSRGDVSSRLYVSPNYLQDGLTVAYLEINGALRSGGALGLGDDWRLDGHVGYFVPLAGNARTAVRKNRTDLRFDLVRRIGNAEVSLGWARAMPQAFPARWRTGGGVVAGVTAYF